MNQEKEYIIIDKDTGEIVTELNKGDTILRAGTKDYLQTTIDINQKEQFVKVYIKTLFQLSNDLTGAESILLLYLIQYINYTDGILEKDKDTFLTRDIICQETEQSERQIDKLMAGLITKQIIGKHKTGRNIAFTVNPFIFMRGRRIDKALFELYKKTKWAKLFIK
jgi:hypothetical protein